MKRWLLPICLLCVLAILAAGCGLLGDDNDSDKSGTGDGCTQDSDCKNGLVCDDNVCVPENDVNLDGDKDSLELDSAEGEAEEEEAGIVLTWQTVPAVDQMKWQPAVDYCDTLEHDGFDDWRLPTIGELRTLVRGCDVTMTDGFCHLTDDCLVSTCRDDSCDGCAENEGPQDGCYWQEGLMGTCLGYWSSSSVEDDDTLAWLLGFGSGVIYYGTGKDEYLANVRCVREE